MEVTTDLYMVRVYFFYDPSTYPKSGTHFSG